jgi:hypothetical protein
MSRMSRYDPERMMERDSIRDVVLFLANKQCWRPFGLLTVVGSPHWSCGLRASSRHLCYLQLDEHVAVMVPILTIACIKH